MIGNLDRRSVAVVMVGLGAVVVAACTSAEPNRGLSNIRLAGDDGNDQLSLNCSNRGRVRVNDGRPAEGPIALTHHGAKKDGVWVSPPSLVQFPNISISELR